MKILLVEDDALLAQALVRALSDQHYLVDVASDGQAGWELLESFVYDVVLLDVELPKLDGISLCQRLRSQGNVTPILLLTARDTNTDKVLGLDAGADDYVVKPFNLQELLARIRAVLRRGGTALPPLLQWQNLALDPSLCEVTCNAQPLHLTPKEYGLLELFLRNPHRIFSLSGLIDQIWSFEGTPSEDTIRSHIRGLRQKLKAAGVTTDPIETVYGIGYRLKPVEKPAAEISNPRKQSRPNPEQEAIQLESSTTVGIAEIWQQVKETVHQRLGILEAAIAQLQQNQLSEELQHQAEQAVHKLVGSLGMFGAEAGSRLAQAIYPLLERAHSLDRHQRHELTQLVQELRHVLQGMESQPLPELLTDEEPMDVRPWLFIVSADRPQAQQLAVEATSWGMRSQIIPDPVMAREQIADHRPDAVILDLAGVRSPDNYLTLLAELGAYTPPVSSMILTDQNNVLDRVKIARLGGGWVLQQPIVAAQVLEALNQQLHRKRPAEARVMIVDDDRPMLMALQRLLIPWGLYVSVLDNPLLFLDTLETTTPDLLILDIEMPHINGIELCQVVRNDPRWSGLPILFLTAHTDADTMQRVFAAGGDDFVCKPIVGPELVTRIFNRLERSHLLRMLSDTDTLTGVANRRKSSQSLSEFIQWSKHCHRPLCFAIVKLNHLGRISQQYGHATTDEILIRFGELLRQTFHSEDVVGRWGGAEFVVGMSGLTRTEGKQRLAELQQRLHQFEFKAPDQTRFRATFRAGLAQYPEDGDSLDALYPIAQTELEPDGRR